MIRPLLPVMGMLFLCAQSFAAMAADDANASTSAAQLRELVEAQRAQLSGAATVTPVGKTGEATVLDAEVQTEDAPAQAQQP